MSNAAAIGHAAGADLSDTLLVYALACAGGTQRALKGLLCRWRLEQGRALAELFECPEDSLRALLFPAERALVAAARAHLADTQVSLSGLEAEGIRALSMFDEEYPQALVDNMAAGAVPLLFLRGDARILRRPGIAVVGSRVVPEPAKGYARALAGRLAADGCNVVSGFAPGVDQAAYEGAVERGATTLVRPSGLRTFLRETPYIEQHVASGRLLAMSQLLPDAPWMAQQAMARNVIIHALAHALVVVAAGIEGGTWFAAREGLRRGRLVFVRSLPPDDHSCPGNARLIEQGAEPLSCDADVAADAILVRCVPFCAE